MPPGQYELLVHDVRYSPADDSTLESRYMQKTAERADRQCPLAGGRAVCGVQAGKEKGQCWSRSARWRACLLTVLCLTATFFLLFSCLQPASLRQRIFCCGEYGTMVPSSRRLEGHSPGEDYADYDPADEGSDSEHIRYKHTKRRLPAALIIGARKCGTRALLEFLNLHPAIQAQKREMHFFDDDDNYSLGLEWYRKKMPYSFSGQLTVEKTPAYFIEEYVPERVFKMNASMRLLLVVRDPTERAISDYTQIHTNRLEKQKQHDSFEELILDEDTGAVRMSYKVVRRSLYYRHMERWLRWFPLPQILVVSGERLISQPWEEMRRVEDFLQLDHKLGRQLFYLNATRRFYCMRHEDGREKCLARSKGRTHPDVNPLVLRKLHQFFRPYNQIFYDQIGRDLGWP